MPVMPPVSPKMPPESVLNYKVKELYLLEYIYNILPVDNSKILTFKICSIIKKWRDKLKYIYQDLESGD